MAENTLLSVLMEDDRQRFESHMMRFEMPAGSVLINAGQDVVDTWFPCGHAMAAFCLNSADGAAVDIGYVGREGALGGIVSNGHIPAYSTVVVRISGPFLRIKTSALEQLKLESLNLRHWFSRYSDCLLAQVFQTSACNATHTIRQRIAKLILAGFTRTGEQTFAMTQEELAHMLGVGRTFVNRVLGTLRAEKIISSRRGMIIIEDLPALRAISCGCTAAIEDHYDAVMHGIYSSPF